jgi:hypothetical protein
LQDSRKGFELGMKGKEIKREGIKRKKEDQF